MLKIERLAIQKKFDKLKITMLIIRNIKQFIHTLILKTGENNFDLNRTEVKPINISIYIIVSVHVHCVQGPCFQIPPRTMFSHMQ